MNVNLQLATQNKISVVIVKSAVYCWNTLKAVGFWSNRKMSDCSPTIAGKQHIGKRLCACNVLGNVNPRTVLRSLSLFCWYHSWAKTSGYFADFADHVADRALSSLERNGKTRAKEGSACCSSMKKWSCSVILFTRKCSSIDWSPK